MKQNNCLSEINQIALPLILSSITSVLMGIVDQAFVGHISVYAYAGVGLVYSCINSLVGVLGAFSIVFNICGSRLKGEENKEGLNEEFSLMCILCGGVGLILFLLFNVFYQPILNIGFGLTGGTLKEAIRYLRIFSLTIPLNLLIFIYNGVFKIFRKTGHIFGVTLFTNVVNIVLDYVLIFGKFGMPRLGTAGAAIGTVLAVIINLCIYGWIARKYVRSSGRVAGLLGKLKNKLRFSLPFLGQEVMEDILFVVGMNMLVARMGTIQLSVYNLILQIISIIQMPMFGYATATTSLASEAYGRGNGSEIRSIRRNVAGMLCVWFALLFTVIMFNSHSIIRFISEDGEVLKLAAACLPVALFTQLFNYGINIEKPILQSAGYSGYTLVVTFLVNVVTIILIGLFAAELMRVYIMLGAGYLAVYGVLRYKSGRSVR